MIKDNIVEGQSNKEFNQHRGYSTVKKEKSKELRDTKCRSITKRGSAEWSDQGRDWLKVIGLIVLTSQASIGKCSHSFQLKIERNPHLYRKRKLQPYRESHTFQLMPSASSCAYAHAVGYFLV